MRLLIRAFPSLLATGAFAMLMTVHDPAFAGSPPTVADADARQTRRIEYLIHVVETLQGATFIRNGVEYGAAAAAEHLRLKWRSAGRHVITAEDFVRLCASGSSISGLPYKIRFADGRTVTSEEFLRQKLADYALLNPD